MRYDLPNRVFREIVRFAQKNNTEKVILFGSRAMGLNTSRSDVDLAVYGGFFDGFYWDMKENSHTLLSFDVVDANSGISEELAEEIKKNGVVIYEKA